MTRREMGHRLDNTSYRLSIARAGTVMGCLAAAPITFALLFAAQHLLSLRGLLLSVPVGIAYIAAGWFAAEPPRLLPSIKAGALAGAVAGTSVAVLPVMLGIAFGSFDVVLATIGAILVGLVSQVPIALALGAFGGILSRPRPSATTGN